MAIKLNHTIVPARDKEASARFFAQIFGLTYDGPMGHFAPVRVNEDLTLDFDNAESFEIHHYAFYVTILTSMLFFSAYRKPLFPMAATLGAWRIGN